MTPWWRAGFLSLLLVGCTKPNPNNCESGVCSDPALPYCDVDGAISGTPKTCVAVDCTANAFQACSADSEVRCNAAGDNYVTTQCAHGCDDAAGCRLCEANQTVCANGEVQTCDASGAVSASHACPLGCFEDQPRCREIDPSNGLAKYMDMAASGPDLVLDHSIRFPQDMPSTVNVVTLPAVAGGAPLAIVPIRSLTISNVVDLYASGDASPPAVVFLVSGPVEIQGTIRLPDGEDQDATYAPAGAITAGDCVGAHGNSDIGNSSYYISGGGGGGGATVGGAGGAQYLTAAAGGSAFLHPDLQPLRGGCAGGSRTPRLVANGGGAIQISSATSIHLGANSQIDANGVSGLGDPGDGTPFSQFEPSGGGSGGGILLEAPVVTLDSGVLLTADGGSGVSGDGHAGTPPSGRTPARGGVCTLAASICTNGGDGGYAAGPGHSADSIAYSNQRELHTGAGGGSVGLIRINTSTGTYKQASDTYVSPSPSAGTIKTR